MALPALKHTCNHDHSHDLSAYIDTSNFDPTRTLSLRNAFAREMAKRFTRLRGVIRKAVVDQDVFGLMSTSNVVALAEFNVPRKNSFAFPRSADKVQAFTSWLGQQEQAGILETTAFQQVGAGVERAWTNKFVEAAYKRGVTRARSEMRKAGYDVPTIAETGGVDIVITTPIHADRVGLLYTRTFNDLKGITDAMDGQISRVLAQAMADGKGPREIARLLTKTISGPVGDLGLTDTLGRFIPAERRAKILARTEIIRAHSDATLQEYKSWGVEGVIVRAEFVTAGDDRVCAECQALEGQTYTLKEAEGIIPVHPQCRCIFLPKDVTRQ